MEEKQRIDYLPVGSVVMVKGMLRKAVIIGRGLMTMPENELMYFDYGGCLYPEGLQGDSIMYFNHRDITEVVFRGYEDEDEKRAADNLNLWLAETGTCQAEPAELNRILREKKKKER